MKGNRLGKVRRSQVVTTFGPGAIIDFRAGGHGGAAVSVVAAGLDAWDRWAKPAGLANQQSVYEPRLQKKLEVKGFRLPPVGTEMLKTEDGKEKYQPLLPGVRFPTWLLCPGCDRLQYARKWSEDPGDPALYCAKCTTDAGRRVHVVPVRFILACEHGHLDEFPWDLWVGHKNGCNRKVPLELKSQGAGLKGLMLKCRSCGARETMDGAFSPDAMKRLNVKCHGKRPWLPGEPEKCKCSNPPVVVQRGASNLYFPATESALDIPPWSDDFQQEIGDLWWPIANAPTPEDRDRIVEHVLWTRWEGTESLEELKIKVRLRVELINVPERPSLRFEEYQQLTLGQTDGDENSEFSIRPEPVPASLSGLLGQVIRVMRLREVRATYGFTRIHPPSGEFGTAELAKLSEKPKNWYPAIEVRGEGIFLTLDEQKVREWETHEDAKQRAVAVHDKYVEDWQQRMGEESSPPLKITPRFLLVHTFSHALMRQLSMQCGYSTSSLRERLYVDDTAPGMCGVLIYTSTSDADGTLGGLVRQGRAKRLEALVRSAVRAIEWCSSDPLCMKGINSLSDGLNLAACHSCSLAPETACETFNRFLDRAVVVGQPGNPGIGFFSRLLDRS